MSRRRAAHITIVGLWGGVLLGTAAPALPQPYRPGYMPSAPRQQQPTAARVSPEALILQALRADPTTAPYAFTVARRGGKIALKGVVGTKVVHDNAVRIAMAVTPSIEDDLVIDTLATTRAVATLERPAAAPVGGIPAVGPVAGAPISGPTVAGAGSALGGYPSASVPAGPIATGGIGYGLTAAFPGGWPVVYPPPLFGFYDEPFYGFVPPTISYPPWWGAMSVHRLGLDRPAAAAALAAPMLQPPQAPAQDQGQTQAAPAPATESGRADATVEMTIDPRGVAVLRGTVPTLADSIAIGQELARTPGVAEVRNELTVERPGGAVPGTADRNQPPAPPRPEPQPETRAQPRARRPQGAAIEPGEIDLDARLAAALDRRPALKDLDITARARGGIATLEGRVPTVYEDMLAFRAAQQTPGVDRVVDRLEFRVPDGEGKNPLIEKGRPEDVEPYLEAQIKGQVGDQAHVDRVRLTGDDLEVRGTVARPEDRARVEAILRSMPILRGFRVDSKFLAD